MNKREWYESGLYREFQTTVQDWLNRTGMSQLTAAHTCGFSQSVINRWLSETWEYLVQPTHDTLVLLSPKIGVDLDELERQAGRRDVPVPTAKRPVELTMFLRDVEAGYWAHSDEYDRAIRMGLIRTVLPAQPAQKHVRRPSNRRIKGNNAGLDQSKADYRTHKLIA